MLVYPKSRVGVPGQILLDVLKRLLRLPDLDRPTENFRYQLLIAREIRSDRIRWLLGHDRRQLTFAWAKDIPSEY